MNARTDAAELAGDVRILVFNAGSSSLKFELIEFAGRLPGRSITAGSFAAVDGSGLFRGTAAGEATLPSATTLAEAAALALDWLSGTTRHGQNLLDKGRRDRAPDRPRRGIISRDDATRGPRARIAGRAQRVGAAA